MEQCSFQLMPAIFIRTFAIASGLTVFWRYGLGIGDAYQRSKPLITSRAWWFTFGAFWLQGKLLRAANCTVNVPLIKDSLVARDMRAMLRQQFPRSAWVAAVSAYVGEEAAPDPENDRALGPCPGSAFWDGSFRVDPVSEFSPEHEKDVTQLSSPLSSQPAAGLPARDNADDQTAAFPARAVPATPSARDWSRPAAAAPPAPHAAAPVIPWPVAAADAGRQTRPSLPGAPQSVVKERDVDGFSVEEPDAERREGGAGRWGDEEERRKRREARWQALRAREAGIAAPPAAAEGGAAAAGGALRPRPPPPSRTAAHPDRAAPQRVRRNEFGDEIADDE